MKSGKKVNKKLIMAVIALLLVLTCSFVIMFSSGSLTIFNRFYIASDPDYYLTGSYSEFLGGDKAYSYFPKPNDLGNYTEMRFRFWKYKNDKTDKGNTFFLDLRYEKNNFENVVLEIIKKYDLVDKGKYYSFYLLGEDQAKIDRYFYTHTDERFIFETQNYYLIFTHGITKSNDVFLICINNSEHRVRFIFNCGGNDYISISRLNNDLGPHLWGELVDEEDQIRAANDFWEKHPPV